MEEIKKRKAIINKWIMREMFEEAGYIYLLILYITKNMLQKRIMKMIMYSLI